MKYNGRAILMLAILVGVSLGGIVNARIYNPSAGGGSSSSSAGVFATSTDNTLAYMKDGDSGVYAMLIGGSATTTDVGFEMGDGASSTDGYIAVGSSGGGVLILDENGNLGLNDSTPSYKLDVNGTMQATGNSVFGGTLSITGNVTSLGTLTGKDLVATSSLVMPVDVVTTTQGGIYQDSTENQVVAYGTAARVMDEDGIRSFCWTISSSTDIVSGDYLEGLRFPYASVTVFYQDCIAQDGTSQVINLADTGGTNNMTSITCANTTATGTPSSNNTFTGGPSVAGYVPENVRMEFGTNTGNVKRISYCGLYRINAQ